MAVHKVIHASPRHGNILVVNWCLSNVCNFSCSYCPDILHNRSIPFPDPIAVLQFCSRIKEHYQDKELFFEFTGGEVTLWKDLPLVLNHLRQIGARSGIISNGSRTLDWWSKNADCMDHVCLSFHSEQAKKDHYLAVAEMLSERLSLHLNIMMSPKNFDACIQVAEGASRLKNVSIALQPLIIDFKDQLFDYTPEQMEIINNQQKLFGSKVVWDRSNYTYRGNMQLVDKKSKTELAPHEIIAKGLNRWKGWTCSIGIEQLVVDFHGQVMKGWCQVGGILGNIADKNIQFPRKPQVCDKNFCHCNLDIMSTKTLPGSVQDTVHILET